MTLVVDASIAVKVYVEEDGSEVARALLTRRELLVAPAHMTAEACHVLVDLARKGLIPRAQLDTAVSGLGHAFVSIDLDVLLKRAAAIALGAGVTVYDALYVAAAERVDALLVTADLKLLRRLEGTEWARFAMSLDAAVRRPEPDA